MNKTTCVREKMLNLFKFIFDLTVYKTAYILKQLKKNTDIFDKMYKYASYIKMFVYILFINLYI